MVADIRRIQVTAHLRPVRRWKGRRSPWPDSGDEYDLTPEDHARLYAVPGTVVQPSEGVGSPAAWLPEPAPFHEFAPWDGSPAAFW